MKKIPTIFVRDMTRHPARVTPEWKPGCEWVRDGEGRSTIKLDGTCCMVREGVLYKRREIKPGQQEPMGFQREDFDEETGKTVGWVKVGDGSEDRWHREAFNGQADGTYELIGPKVQGNKYDRKRHELEPHGEKEAHVPIRTFDAILSFLCRTKIEGFVWHHPDGRMAKIKRKDFDLEW